MKLPTPDKIRDWAWAITMMACSLGFLVMVVCICRSVIAKVFGI